MLSPTIIAALSAFAGQALAADHIVAVAQDAMGQPALEFYPPVIEAAVGDTVTFQFYPEEHNVLQGMASSPCQPAPGAFFSTDLETDSGMNPMQFVLTVNNTEPMYFFCEESNHCQEGMVGIINGDMEMYNSYRQASMQTSESGEPPSEDVTGGVLEPVSGGSSSTSGGEEDDQDDDSGMGDNDDGAATLGVAKGAIALALFAFGLL